MNMYLFKDYFNSADMLSLVGFAGVLPMLALAPFAAKLSKRFGKKEAGCVGVGVAAAAYLLMWALRLRSVWAYIGLMLVGSVGVGFFNMVVWAFITDVIDYQEVRTGSRDDGTVYAVYSFARKLGQALAGGVVGFCTGGHRLCEQHGPCGADAACTRGHLHHFHAGARPELSRRVPCAAAGLSAHQKARGGKRCRAARTARRSGTGAVAAPAGRTARAAYDNFPPGFPGHIYHQKREGKHMKHILPINEGWAFVKGCETAPAAIPAGAARVDLPPLERIGRPGRRQRLLARPMLLSQDH